MKLPYLQMGTRKRAAVLVVGENTNNGGGIGGKDGEIFASMVLIYSRTFWLFSHGSKYAP
jgi:hypothetical protein